LATEPKESASPAKENGRQTENQPDFGLVLDAFGALVIQPVPASGQTNGLRW